MGYEVLYAHIHFIESSVYKLYYNYSKGIQKTLLMKIFVFQIISEGIAQCPVVCALRMW